MNRKKEGTQKKLAKKTVFDDDPFLVSLFLSRTKLQTAQFKSELGRTACVLYIESNIYIKYIAYKQLYVLVSIRNLTHFRNNNNKHQLACTCNCSEILEKKAKAVRYY